MPAPIGISLAPDDHCLTGSPSWQRIDLDYNVQTWQIDRGRPNEMSRTSTGTAQLQLVDVNGDFDPTNPTGAFYNRAANPHGPMGPLVQAAICLQNPATDVWSILFRGFVSQIQWQPAQTLEFANVTIDLVDALAVFAACEMTPGRSWGDDVIDGNIVFDQNTTLHAVEDRINQVCDQLGWPSALRSVFSGNVQLQQTVYAPRTSALTVIQDAADAEFPDVANVFIGGPTNPGALVFHGRYARFNSLEADYQLNHWKAGDDRAAGLDSACVRISPPLTASLDDTDLYTSALAAPQNIADGDIAAQYVEDAAAVAVKGLRTWSAENLATMGGAGPTTGEQETKKFAQYVVDNFVTPRVRVGQLTVKGRRVGDLNGPRTWALICQVDISDVVHLTTTHSGGGGFADDFYVEGIHYQVAVGTAAFPNVTLTLDVSPAGYYALNPFT